MIRAAVRASHSHVELGLLFCMCTLRAFEKWKQNIHIRVPSFKNAHVLCPTGAAAHWELGCAFVKTCLCIFKIAFPYFQIRYVHIRKSRVVVSIRMWNGDSLFRNAYGMHMAF